MKNKKTKINNELKKHFEGDVKMFKKEIKEDKKVLKKMRKK